MIVQLLFEHDLRHSLDIRGLNVINGGATMVVARSLEGAGKYNESDGSQQQVRHGPMIR